MLFFILIAAAHVVLTWGLSFRRGLAARAQVVPAFELIATPLVSVLVPAWKERSVLQDTLQALRQLTYPNWEAIVVAGGPDGTEEYARALARDEPRFQVVAQPPRGKNAALNLGLARARGEIVVLLDADTIVEPNWLSLVAAPFAYGIDAVTADYRPSVRSWVSAYFEMQKIAAYFVRASTSLHGGGFAVRRTVVDRLGGFPEQVTVGVDWDLDQRVDRLGVRKVFIRDAHHRTPLAHTVRGYFHDELRWRRAHLRALYRFLGFDQIKGSIFYAVAIVFFAAPLLILTSVPWLWPILWAWILLRRAGLAIEAAAYTGEKGWLARAWIPMILTAVDFADALAALMTVSRRQIFFQGPRPSAREAK